MCIEAVRGSEQTVAWLVFIVAAVNGNRTEH